MKSSSAGLALSFLRGDLHSGELRIFLLSIALAVAAFSAVGFLTSRVEASMTALGAELLAADIVVEHGEALPESFVTRAQAAGLKTARILSFPSALIVDDRPVLVQVKGVGPGYPLRGRLSLSPARSNQTDHVPQPDEAWAEGRLFNTLGAAAERGIRIGSETFRLTRTIVEEPDRGGNLIRLAPRLMLSLEGVTRTGLLGPASRVKHRLLVAGERASVTEFAAWAREQLPRGAKLIGIDHARPEFRLALERAHRFLSLAALGAALLSAAAIMLSMWHYVSLQTDAAAIMRTLGAQSGTILRLFLLRIGLLGGIGTLLGIALGYIAQFGLHAVLGDWFGSTLPLPGWYPALHGFLLGLALVIGFGLVPLLPLRRVSPLRVLRRDIKVASPSVALAALVSLGTLVLLVLQIADDAELTGRVLGGLLAVLLILAGLSRLLLLMTRRNGPALPVIAALNRRPGHTLLQASAMGLGILVLMLLIIVRTELLDAWQRSLPADAPDHFVLNVQPDETAALAALLTRHGITHTGIHPMIRARFTHLRGEPVDPAAYDSARAQRLAAREFNLSHTQALQQDNKVVAGQWWTGERSEQPLFSVESGLARELGMQLGDELRFDVAGETVIGRVGSLRDVRWDSFNVNFFVVGTPSLLGDLPGSWLTSFHLPAEKQSVIGEIAREFPASSVLDVEPLITQVRRVIERGSRAVEMVFGFTLLAGLLVLAAAVQATRNERATDVAIYRTLGASRRQIDRNTIAEFGLLGLLASLPATLVASITGYGLAVFVFELPWSPAPQLWIGGLALGTLSVILAGLIATRGLSATPPVRILR